MHDAPKKRILIVDDDASTRGFVRVLLASDYDIVEAGSCEEALALLDERGPSFELVLLDVGFGAARLQGDDALETIRRKWPRLEVVMISMENDIPVVVRCIRRGAFDYVTKGPEMIATLPRKIAQAIAIIEMRQENARLRRECERRRLPQAAELEDVIRPFDEITREHFSHAVRVCRGDLKEAAARLQIPYTKFRRRLIELGLLETLTRDE